MVAMYNTTISVVSCLQNTGYRKEMKQSLFMKFIPMINVSKAAELFGMYSQLINEHVYSSLCTTNCYRDSASTDTKL